MRILITGHMGFVGRHFMKSLRGDGHYICGLDLQNGMDCRDFFKEASPRQQFDLVIHLAAIVGGRQNIDKNPLSVATDLSIDAEMFNWFKRTNQRGKLVYFSSSAAYSVLFQRKLIWQPLNEDMLNFVGKNGTHVDWIGRPDMSYGWSKLTGEYLSSFLQSEQVLIFRPFSGYGEDQDLTYPFPSFIRRGIQRQNPFEIWGDGNQIRDFIHIDDIVDATLLAVESNMSGVYNLGTGVPTSFIDLANKVCSQIGYEPSFDFKLDNPVGVYGRVADISKMKTFYSPKVSLEEGITRSIYENTYRF